MLLGRKIDQHIPTDHCVYQLIETNVIGMGPKRVHSYSILKIIDGKVHRRIINGVKNKDAAFLTWQDVKNGIQK